MASKIISFNQEERRWQGELQKETTGLIGILALWILGRPYNLGIEGLMGISLNLLKPKGASVELVLLMIDLNFTRNLSSGEVCKGLKESELRKSKTLSTYWSLFKTTTQLPLSALVTTKSLFLSFLRNADKSLISWGGGGEEVVFKDCWENLLSWTTQDDRTIPCEASGTPLRMTFSTQAERNWRSLTFG